MHPILIQIGPFNIYSYGVMIAVSFGLMTLLMYRQARRFNLDPDRIVDLMVLLLVSGIVGARLLYIALNFDYYLLNPLEVFNLSKGGLVWYGGFFVSLLALVFYLRKNRISFWVVADLVSPYLALAQALGRIGCFLNGCCYGTKAPSGFFWVVTFPGESVMRYPVQIYSSLALLAIYVILRIEQNMPRRFFGEIFLSYCLLYSSQRFVMEFLRGDNPKILLGYTISQGIGIAVILASLALFIYRRGKWQRENLSLK